MKQPLTLERVLTKDNFWLDGLVWWPKIKTQTAVVWVHGYGSNFYIGLERIKELSQQATKSGFAFTSFNTRGRDLLSTLCQKRKPGQKKKKSKLSGSGAEVFNDCIFDIKGIIDWLSQQGIKKVYLLGHSTGANKVLYYVYKKQDKRVKGLGLLGPISDIASQRYLLGTKFFPILSQVKKIIRRKPNDILPTSLSSIPMTAKRYLSLYTPGGSEDVFPYYNPRAEFKELVSIKIPLLVLVGEKDEFSDRPAKDLIKIFQTKAIKVKNFSGQIIAGSNHGFNGYEKQLAQRVVNWIKRTL